MQGLGYLISTLSVGLLGVIAWPRPEDPQWKTWVLIGGMIASVAGMALRYLEHRKQERELKRTEQAAGVEPG